MSYLGFDKSQRRADSSQEKNYRNGSTKRTLKTQLGEVQINVPRDRNGEFESGIIGKYQRNADGLEERILSLYATGMSLNDIKDQIKQLYDVDISSELVSKITDKIMPIVTDWQNRPLDNYYPFVFMDAIHYHVRYEGRIVKKAVYIAIGINLDGRKDVLGSVLVKTRVQNSGFLS